MEIIVAKRAGFCFGVKRAIDITLDIARSKKSGIYTLGPLIHNPQVIKKLTEQGIKAIEAGDLDRDDIRALIIRTHGIPCDVYDNILRRGLTVIDATCPFVKKAQDYAKLLKENGYQVVILGDRDHPEVKGLMSFAGEDAVVIDNAGQIPKLKPKVGIVVQTTQPMDMLKKALAEIVQKVRELKVYNTICSSTAQRLKETEELAHKVDVVIVVGGKNSANTSQVANLCRGLSVRTHHVETSDEIDASWFKDTDRVGITAGASTPDWIIREVEERIRDIGGRS